jgi:hypothetical protein
MAGRRIFFGGLMLAMGGLAAHAQTRDPSAPMVGAYGAFEPLDDEAKAVFQQAVGPQPEDLQYAPLTVARQVVAGMNFCFTADQRSRAGLSRVRIFVFKPLSGAPRVTKIEPLS